MKKNDYKRWAMYAVGVVLCIAMIVAARTMPHPDNFTPVVAVALFAGFLFPSRRLAILVPLGGMIISDVFFISVYTPAVMFTVYACLMAPALIGPLLRKQSQATKKRGRLGAFALWMARVLGATAGVSTIFFICTNLAVWKFSGMYAPSVEGLAQCFALALPFFKNTLIGDLCFSGIIFGAYAAVRWGMTVYNNSDARQQLTPPVVL